MDVFCPATMCPLFARDGSPWTGAKNSPCPQKPAFIGKDERDDEGCAFFNECTNACDGGSFARRQAEEAGERGGVAQIGPVRQRRDKERPRAYDCPRAGDCQWQIQAGEELCGPRYALSIGVDPKSCAW